MAWFRSLSSSLHRLLKKRHRFPNPSLQYGVHSGSDNPQLKSNPFPLKFHLRQFNNRLKRRHSNLLKHRHNNLGSNRSNKDGLNSHRNNKDGPSLKRHWFNQPFARECTAETVGSALTHTGAFVRSAASKISAIESSY
jgi:hypothetical protein